jgi:transposase-like protein
MSRLSKSQVWQPCAKIDERVNASLTRPIEGEWPYLWIDATYLDGAGGRADRLGGRDNGRGGEPRS